MSLHAALVRHVLYPLHERLRGRPTLATLRELRRCARSSAIEARAQLAERLRALLTFAHARVPFYIDHLARHAVCVDAADILAEFAKLPVLRKADVRAQAERMTWPDVPGGLIPHSSGGTSGDTLHFHVDRTRQAEDLAARLFMQSRYGVQPGMRRVHLWGSPIEARGGGLKRWRDRALNEFLLNAFQLGPEQLDAHLARIRRLRPALLYSYPTAAALVARHAARRWRPEDFHWLRLVVLTGEEVTADQIEQVRAAFGCPVAVEYGNREVGLIAHTCPQGRLHLVSPHIYTEVMPRGATVTRACDSHAAATRGWATASHSQTTAIGESGEEAARADAPPRGYDPGSAVGDIVCTTLNTRAQPFIRYQVGDLGRLELDACTCGLPWPLLRIVGGRVTGFFALPDGRLCHGAVNAHILRHEPGVVAFKTYQHTLHEFEVLLMTDERFDPRARERIRQHFRLVFGPRAQVEVRQVDQIPPDPSGKRRHVVSAVAAGYDAYDVMAGAASRSPPQAPGS